VSFFCQRTSYLESHIDRKFESESYEEITSKGGKSEASFEAELFVNPFGTETGLLDRFSEFGKIRQAWVPLDSAGKRHNHGSITFDSRDSAEAAQSAFNGKSFESRKLTVEFSTRSQEQTAARQSEEKPYLWERTAFDFMNEPAEKCVIPLFSRTTSLGTHCCLNLPSA
jgi:hypothetical protein